AKALVDKAHQLGMYVFFDGVFGHHKGTVAPSPSGRKPASSKRRAKYPGSLKFYEEVATYWIDTLGIDGWRLDQAQQVPVQYWEEIRQAVEATCRERYAAGKKWGTLGYMVAEVWAGETDIARQAYGNRDSVGLYSAFDFPVRYRLVQCLAVEESGKGRKPASILAEGYATHQVYPHHAIPNLMLSSHDLVRFGDLIQRAGLSGKENPHYWKRHQCAFSFMAAYTGPITIYYNDEIGYELEGFAKRVTERCWEKNLCDDHVSRTPGKISGLTTKEQDLKNYVARLMRFRDVHPALWKGKRTNLIATEHIYADLKEFDGDRILYILNVSPQERTVSLSQSILGTQILIDSDDHKKIMAADGEFRIHLPGLCGQFFIVE
ncbi:glycosidase, partial [Candidatus Saccharibacteria bacterium]|nr:glycosidase [Calditrichia bacterium]NIW00165.1 glycosidase [Candidatus Saccharibacteria bacterium]NIW80508.1 glycosidase [Calditrichia bacterium]